MMQQWTGVNFIFYFGTSFFVSEIGPHSSKEQRKRIKIDDSIAKSRYHFEPFPDRPHHDFGQRLLDSSLLLDH
jgi:hypothetical protein